MGKLTIALLAASALYAQPSVVAHTLGQCLASNTAFTTGSACGGSSIVGSAIDTTGSSLLLACPMVFGGTPGAVSDSKGNTWTGLTGYTTGNFNVKMFYTIPPDSSHIGTGHTFTLAASGPGTFNSMGVVALVGTQAATALRAMSDTGGATGSNLTLTPTATHDVLATCLSDDNATAKTISGGSFTVLDSTTTTGNGETGATAWEDAPSTTAISFGWSTVGIQNGAVFEVGATPGGGGGTVLHQLLTLGVGK